MNAVRGSLLAVTPLHVPEIKCTGLCCRGGVYFCLSRMPPTVKAVPKPGSVDGIVLFALELPHSLFW